MCCLIGSVRLHSAPAGLQRCQLPAAVPAALPEQRTSVLLAAAAGEPLSEEQAEWLRERERRTASHQKRKW